MNYTLSWYVPKRVVSLELTGKLTPDDLQMINQEMMQVLDKYEANISILINATDLVAGYDTAHRLRDTQKYIYHPKLDSIYVVTENKINRLITLLAFSTCRAKFMLFKAMPLAQQTLVRHGFDLNGYV